MAKWTLPEGHKPLTDADMAALTRRLAGTAVDYKELYEAAKRYDPANAWGQAYMRVEAFGRWVAYKDYAALRARLAEVEKERDAKISPDQVQDLVDLAEPMLSNALGEAEGEIAALHARSKEAVETLRKGFKSCDPTKTTAAIILAIAQLEGHGE